MISRGSIMAPVKPVSTTHPTVTSPAKWTARIGSRAEFILPDVLAMAVKRVGGFIANSGEIKDALRHCGMSLYQRGSSRIARKVLASIWFDGRIASSLIRFKQNAKRLCLKSLICSHSDRASARSHASH